MKKKFGLKQLIILTIVYGLFVAVDIAIEHYLGIHPVSLHDMEQVLGLIAIGILWIWYFVDKWRKHKNSTEG